MIQADIKVEFESRSEMGQLGHNNLTKKKNDIRLNSEQNYKANTTTAKIIGQTGRCSAAAIMQAA